jgi:hypothetical protein
MEVRNPQIQPPTIKSHAVTMIYYRRVAILKTHNFAVHRYR